MRHIEEPEAGQKPKGARQWAMHKGNLRQGWRRNQNPQNVFETNFKAVLQTTTLKRKLFDAFNVHPGLQTPKGPWVEKLQQGDAVAKHNRKVLHPENRDRRKSGQTN